MVEKIVGSIRDKNYDKIGDKKPDMRKRRERDKCFALKK